MESVAVSLERGLAEIRFRPDSRATLRQVQDAIRHNGFSPKAAELQVRGTVVLRSGAPSLAVPGEPIPYRIGLPANALELAARLVALPEGRAVVVEGTVAEPPKPGEAPTVAVARVREAGP